MVETPVDKIQQATQEEIVVPKEPEEKLEQWKLLKQAH